jgi:hypothetical protein
MNDVNKGRGIYSGKNRKSDNPLEYQDLTHACPTHPLWIAGLMTVATIHPLEVEAKQKSVIVPAGG